MCCTVSTPKTDYSLVPSSFKFSVFNCLVAVYSIIAVVFELVSTNQLTTLGHKF